MAQVRKYNTGGSATNYGKFIRDGKEYVADEKFLTKLTDFGSTLDHESRRHISDIKNALQKGETVEYDSLSGDISGNVVFTSLSDKQTKRSKRMPSKAGLFIDGLFNTSRNQLSDTLINKLPDFNITEDKKEEPKKTNLYFKKSYINYKLGDDKKTKSFLNTPNNITITDNISKLLEHLNVGEGNTSKYAVHGINEDAIRLYNKNNPNGLTDIWNRAKTGSLTAEDELVLKDLNILTTNDASIAALEAAKAAAKANAAPVSKSGYTFDTSWNNDNNNKEFGIFLHTDGNYYTNSNKYANAYLSDVPSFVNTPFKDGVIYQNRLYTKQEAESNPEVLSAIRPFYQAWNDKLYTNESNESYAPSYNERFERAKNSGFWFPGIDENLFHDTYNSSKNYSPILDKYYRSLSDYGQDKTYNFADLSAKYNIPENEYLVANLANDGVKQDWLGLRRGISYTHYLQDGSFRNYRDESQIPFKKNEGLYANRTSVIPRDTWEVDKSNEKYGLLKTVDTAYGKEHIYVNHKNGNTYIKAGNKFIDIDSNTVNKLLTNPKSVTRDMIYKSYVSPFSQVATTPMIHKNGGIAKYQYGSLMNDRATRVKDVEQTPRESSHTKSVKLKDIGKEGALTDADKLEITSLGADMASLITSYIPGANMVAGGIGLGSTAAQFAADIKRDGFDWGDVKTAAISTGLDVLTFIPGAGGLAKGSKIIRNLKRSAKTLQAAFAGLGMYKAGESLMKLTDSSEKGDWTLDDLRNVFMGIQGITLGKRFITDNKLATVKGEKTKTSLKDTTTVRQKQEALINEKLKTDADLTEKYVDSVGKVDYDKAIADNIVPEVSKIGNTVSNVGIGVDNAKTKIKNKFSRAPRTLRELDYEIKDNLFDEFIRWQKNRAIQRVAPTFINDGTIAGTKNGIITGKPQDIHNPIYREKNNIWWKTNYGRPTNFDLDVEYKGRIPEAVTKNITDNNLTFSKISTGIKRDGTRDFKYFISDGNSRKEFDSIEELVKSLNIPKSSVELPLSVPTTKPQIVHPPVTPTSFNFNIPQPSVNPISKSLEKYFPSKYITSVATSNPILRQQLAKFSKPINNVTPVVSKIGSKTNKKIARSNHVRKNEEGGILENIQYLKYGNTIDGYAPLILSNNQYDNWKDYFYGKYGQSQQVYNVQLPEITVYPSTNVNKSSIPVKKRSITSVKQPIINRKEYTPVIDKSTLTQPMVRVQNVYSPNYAQESKHWNDNPKLLRLQKQYDKQQSQQDNNSNGSWFGKTIAKLGKTPELGIDKQELLTATGVTLAHIFNKRVSDHQAKAINNMAKALPEAPTEHYRRFTDNGLNAAYDNEIKKQLQSKPMTSDSLASLAIEQANQQNVGQMRLDKALQTSNMYQQHLNYLDETKKQYSDIRNDVNYAQRQKLANTAAALNNNDIARDSGTFQTLNNLLKEKQFEVARDKELRDRYDVQLMQNNANLQADVAFNTSIAEGTRDFNEVLNNPEHAKHKEYKNYNNYLEMLAVTNPNEYKKVMENRSRIGNEAMFGTYNKMLKHYKLNKDDYPFLFKKGAKVNPTNVSDKLLIDQNNNLYKAVGQLNKNIMTLLTAKLRK